MNDNDGQQFFFANLIDRVQEILEEKAAVEEENNSLCQDIKSKDEIIKQLTRENLTVNSNLTQV